MTDFEINKNGTIVNAQAELFKLRQEKMKHRIAGNIYKTYQIQKQIEELEREIQTAINFMKKA